MSLYAEIMNDLSSSDVGFRMTQAGSEEDSILTNLRLAGVVYEAQSDLPCKVYCRENRKAPRSGDVSMQCE